MRFHPLSADPAGKGAEGSWYRSSGLLTGTVLSLGAHLWGPRCVGQTLVEGGPLGLRSGGGQFLISVALAGVRTPVPGAHTLGGKQF